MRGDTNLAHPANQPPASSGDAHGQAVRHPPFRREQLVPAGLLTLLTAIAWLATLNQWAEMRGIDMRLGVEVEARPLVLSGLLFTGMWLAMMAGMMFPSAWPMVLLFDRVSQGQRAKGQDFVSTWVFVAGYLAIWTAFGVAAFLVVLGLEAAGDRWDPLAGSGRYVVSGAIGLAGIYQLTPLKRICLKHCRSPLDFLMFHWRRGRAGALRMGLGHGLYCLGCCWALMVLLFAVGVMNLAWMGSIAVIVVIEKLSPLQRWATPAVALILGVLAILVAMNPDLVPGPGGM